MAAMLALVTLALPLQAAAFTASPIAAIPANCGTRAVTNPIPGSCFGQPGSLPAGWTCPQQPGSANGTHSRAAGRICESASGVRRLFIPLPRALGPKEQLLTLRARLCAYVCRRHVLGRHEHEPQPGDHHRLPDALACQLQLLHNHRLRRRLLHALFHVPFRHVSRWVPVLPRWSPMHGHLLPVSGAFSLCRRICGGAGDKLTLVLLH
jgi:hypothetical protein